MSKETVKIFEKNADKLISKLDAINKTVDRDIMTFLKTLETDAGRLLPSDKNIQSVIRFEKELVRNIELAGFGALVEEMVTDVPELLSQLPAGILRKSDAASIKLIQQIDVDDLKGISEDVAKAVRQSLQDMVINGGTYKDAIENVIKASERLKNYSATYINTSRSILSQRITDLQAQHLIEDGEIPYWEYFGAELDDKTRDQCIEGLHKRFYTNDEKVEFQGRGLRWNCRHEFVLITKKYYNNMVG